MAGFCKVHGRNSQNQGNGDKCSREEPNCVDEVEPEISVEIADSQQQLSFRRSRRPHFSSEEVIAIFHRRPDIRGMLTGERMRRAFAALSKQASFLIMQGFRDADFLPRMRPVGHFVGK